MRCESRKSFVLAASWRDACQPASCESRREHELTVSRNDQTEAAAGEAVSKMQGIVKPSWWDGWLVVCKKADVLHSTRSMEGNWVDASKCANVRFGLALPRTPVIVAGFNLA